MDYTVLVKPIITEKSINATAVGKYTFRVLPTATKDQIRAAVESQFKVNVVAITTLNVVGKVRRAGKRKLAYTAQSWKKAIVTLKGDQKIDVFEVK